MSAFNALLPSLYIGLEKYEDDPVMVNAMRDACHYSLYSLANSAAMNGVGEDTTITFMSILETWNFRALSVIFGVLLIGPVIMWIRGYKKLKNAPEYSDI